MVVVVMMMMTQDVLPHMNYTIDSDHEVFSFFLPESKCWPPAVTVDDHW